MLERFELMENILRIWVYIMVLKKMKPQPFFFLIKPSLVYSDHDAETYASPPLLRHSDVTAHFLTEQSTDMNDIMSIRFWTILRT